MTETPRFLSGQLLLAMPGTADPRFARVAIAMAVHDENGAVGIGIGQLRAGISFRELLKQLEIDPGVAPDCAVHHGGPVEPGRGFVLHSDDWGGQDTLHIVGLGAMTGTIDVLRAIAEGRGPARWLVALGYAGCGPGQLGRRNDPPRLVHRPRLPCVLVRHAGRRALGSGLPRPGHRPAIARERDRGGLN